MKFTLKILTFALQGAHMTLKENRDQAERLRIKAEAHDAIVIDALLQIKELELAFEKLGGKPVFDPTIDPSENPRTS